MATVPQMDPKTNTMWPGGRPKTSEELHRDRMALLMVLAIFTVIIALVMWGAMMAPPLDTPLPPIVP